MNFKKYIAEAKQQYDRWEEAQANNPDIKGSKIGEIKNAVRDAIIENDFNVTPEQVKEFILSYEI